MKMMRPPSAANCFRLLISGTDRKSTRLNSSYSQISYAVFCLKKKKKKLISSLHAICESTGLTTLTLVLPARLAYPTPLLRHADLLDLALSAKRDDIRISNYV